MKYSMYDTYFLFLISKYGIIQDEEWWGEAIKRLFAYYDQLAERVSEPSGQTDRKQRTHHLARNKVQAHHRRQCLGQIIDGVFQQFALQRSRLQGIFEHELRECVTMYENRPWIVRWKSYLSTEKEANSINTDETVLPESFTTRALLEFMDARQRGSANVFDIRNRVEWWHHWLKSSGSDLKAELETIIAWINKGPIPVGASLLVSSLMGKLKTEVVKYGWGVTICRLINDANLDFDSASAVIRAYSEYLAAFGPDSDSLLQAELSVMEEISSWYLKAARWHSQAEAAAYGLQLLFQQSVKLGIAMDATDAEDAFLAVSSAHLDTELGGPIARYYFPWAITQSRALDILKYLNWIEAHANQKQAPYVLNYLINALKTVST